MSRPDIVFRVEIDKVKDGRVRFVEVDPSPDTATVLLSWIYGDHTGYVEDQVGDRYRVEMYVEEEA